MLTRSNALAAAILVVFLAAAYAQAPKTVTAVNESDRYQLISSPFSIWMPDGSATTETTVFKIDTVTGRTWKYQFGRVDGKLVNHWAEIPN